MAVVRKKQGLIRCVLVLAAALLVPAAFLSGCGKKTEAPEEAKTGPLGPALWRIVDDDSTIWLFGTFHLLPEATEWRGPKVAEAFANAETLVLEADVEGADQEQLVYLLKTYAIAPPELSLRARLGPERLAALEVLAKELGVSFDTLNGFQPWYAATILSVQFAKLQGFDAQKGVEATLTGEARAAGKSIAYFETVEQQIRFFAELSEETQIEMLGSTVADLKAAGDTLDAMKTAWLSGDLDQMANLINGSLEAEPELYDALMVRRNAAWADEIEEMLGGEGSAFIAVGAGHLVGSESLVDQLRAKGIDVEGP